MDFDFFNSPNLYALAMNVTMVIGLGCLRIIFKRPALL